MEQQQLTIEQEVIQKLSAQVANLNTEMVYANAIIEKLQAEKQALMTALESLKEEKGKEVEEQK